MAFDEVRDLAQDRMMFHERDLLRVITRMSRQGAGIYTILRGNARALISASMNDGPRIDVERLVADMDACVARTSGRAFSLKATGGRNPDFYRNWKDGQNKRLSADVFAGIVTALERDPGDYIIGWSPTMRLPNVTVLTTTFASLLATVGLDPYEGERAQKLARQFPDALQDVLALHDRLADGANSYPEEGAHDPGEGPPAP
jgi:hypothetical protein